jgi:hypothetical protein
MLHAVTREIKCAVIYEKTGTGYSAYMPDLPGCIESQSQNTLQWREAAGGIGGVGYRLVITTFPIPSS